MQVPMPVVQGFVFTSGDPIPNIGKFKNNVLASSEWGLLQQEILASGDRLFRLTKRGSNHPVQTQNLRVDYQGSAIGGVCANQQAQLGGVTSYKGKGNESTSFTCVHADFDCEAIPNINLALQRAHDTSFRTGRIIRVTRAAVVAVVPVVIPVVVARTTVCACGEVITLLDYQRTGTTIYCPNCVAQIVVP